MTVVIVLAVLLFNLLISFGLIAIAYYLAIEPLREELRSLKQLYNKLSQYPANNMGSFVKSTRFDRSTLPDIDDSQSHEQPTGVA